VTFWVDKEGAMASVESRDIVGCEMETKYWNYQEIVESAQYRKKNAISG
jgi:hypothetical protein